MKRSIQKIVLLGGTVCCTFLTNQAMALPQELEHEERLNDDSGSENIQFPNGIPEHQKPNGVPLTPTHIDVTPDPTIQVGPGVVVGPGVFVRGKPMPNPLLKDVLPPGREHR